MGSSDPPTPLSLAHGAIGALGYVRPQYVGALAALIRLAIETGDTKGGARRLRHEGTPLTADERRHAGLKPRRPVLSREAWIMLSEKGQRDPVSALEVSVWHGLSVWYRHRKLSELQEFEALRGRPVACKILGLPGCQGCQIIGAKHFRSARSAFDAFPLPRCEREVCGATILTVMDET